MDVELAFLRAPSRFEPVHVSKEPDGQGLVVLARWTGAGAMEDIRADLLAAIGRFAERTTFIDFQLSAGEVSCCVVTGDAVHGHHVHMRVMAPGLAHLTE